VLLGSVWVRSLSRRLSIKRDLLVIIQEMTREAWYAPSEADRCAIAAALTIKGRDMFSMTEQSVPILTCTVPSSWVQDGLLDIWLGSFQLPVDARIDRLPTTEGTLVFISAPRSRPMSNSPAKLSTSAYILSLSKDKQTELRAD
jgi:hypothetical protein